MDRPAYIDVLYDMNDAELIQAWCDAEPEFQRARMVLQTCEGELVRRMGENLALQSEIGTVVRSPQLGEYQWDREALHKLFGGRLTPEMWAEIEQPVTTVKTRTTAVNKYAKRLGISEAELKACYFRAERKQELEFHGPTDLMAQFQASVDAEREKRGIPA